MLVTVTVCPSFIYNVVDGSEAIDSSSHPDIHVNTYDRGTVLPAKETLPAVDDVDVMASPGLKYEIVVELSTVTLALVAFIDIAAPVNPVIDAIFPERNPWAVPVVTVAVLLLSRVYDAVVALGAAVAVPVSTVTGNGSPNS
jgi:hypothetical protein